MYVLKSKSVLINEREDRSVYSVVGKQYEQWTYWIGKILFIMCVGIQITLFMQFNRLWGILREETVDKINFQY